MKAPKARKLPSGAWFCRVRVNGQDIGITRSTEKEAVAEAMAIKAGIKRAERTAGKDKTLTQAIDDYISARENVLSPSTIAGYRRIQRQRYQDVMQVRLGAMSPERWQRATNQEARRCAAKTLKNAWGFIASVITEATGERVKVQLPQVVENDLPWLTPEEIPVFCDAIRGTPAEIPALLALSSLRQSEVLGLRWTDIDLERNQIKVNGAAVLDEHGKLVYKETNKNQSSRRVIPFILPQLRQALEAVPPEQRGERVINVFPGTLRNQVNRVCEREGLPRVGMHGLRRSFASLALHVGMPEQVAMLVGGWSDIYTMRKIYTKVSQRDVQVQTDRFTAFFGD